MKILLGLQLNEDDSDTNIITTIESTYNDAGVYPILDVKHTITGIYKSIETNKYDAVIIQEHISTARSFSLKDLDNITDRFNGNILFLLGEESSKDNNLLKDLFSLGIYNALKMEDTFFKDIVNLTINGRTKSDAKRYYGIDALEKRPVNNSGLSHVLQDNVIKKIVSNLESASDESLEESYLDVFNNYEFRQNVFIVSRMSEALQERLTGIEEFDRLVSTLHIGQQDNKNDQEADSKENEKEVEIRYIPKIEKKIEMYTEIPDDYKKTILLIGDYGIGATFMTSCLAQQFAEEYTTAVLDMDLKYYDLFFHLSFGNEAKNLSTLIDLEGDITQLLTKNIIGYKTNKNMNVFTEYYKRMKGRTPEVKDIIELINLLKKKHKILMIDMPIYTDRDLIREIKVHIDNVVVVVDQDICRLERIADRLRDLGIDQFDFIVNKYSSKVKNYKEKNIGNIFNNMNLQFNRSFTVSFEEKANKAVASHELYLPSFGKAFKEEIENVANYYYRKNKKIKAVISGIKSDKNSLMSQDLCIK